MYYTQFLMAYDSDLTGRVIQAVASEVQAGHTTEDPERWAADNRHHWAASPGWSEAWDSATAGGNLQPGRDEAVVTDAMVLSSVQQLLGVQAGAPTQASTVVEIQAWLLGKGVSLAPAALMDLDKAELLALVADLLD